MRVFETLRPAALLVAGAAMLAACAPSARVAGPSGPAEPSAAYPAYETFDASDYPAVVPPPAPTEHDVPASVMAGRVDVPGGQGAAMPVEDAPRQVEGQRVQIFSTASRETAERVQREARAWWETARRRPGAPRAMDVQVVYLQPYYRVRMGAFADDAAADAALGLVRTEYPEAFLVPDLVTVGD